MTALIFTVAGGLAAGVLYKLLAKTSFPKNALTTSLLCSIPVIGAAAYYFTGSRGGKAKDQSPSVRGGGI